MTHTQKKIYGKTSYFKNDAKTFQNGRTLTLIVDLQCLSFELRHTNKYFIFETIKTFQIRFNCKHFVCTFVGLVHNTNFVNWHFEKYFVSVFPLLFNRQILDLLLLLKKHNCFACTVNFDVSLFTTQSLMMSLLKILALICTHCNTTCMSKCRENESVECVLEYTNYDGPLDNRVEIQTDTRR